MSFITDKQKALLFDKCTTYKTAYHGDQFPEPVQSAPIINVVKPSKTAQVREILKDVHTMGQWKTQVPFSLWHKPKDIVRTNPYQRLNPCVFQMESTEEERKRAQKTRPRLLITPACSLDDLKDEERQNMIKNIYITSTEECLRSAVPVNNNVVSPLPGTFAKSRPFQMASLRAPYVSPEWRRQSVTWDQQQLRSVAHLTRSFWESRPKPKCRACDETAIIAAFRKKEREMQRFLHQ